MSFAILFYLQRVYIEGLKMSFLLNPYAFNMYVTAQLTKQSFNQYHP